MASIPRPRTAEWSDRPRAGKDRHAARGRSWCRLRRYRNLKTSGGSSRGRSRQTSRSGNRGPWESAHVSTSRPGERRDPYAVSSRFRSVAEAFSKQRCQGLWVPAFAGTTRASAIYLRGRKLHRLAATAGAGLVRIVEDELRRHLVGLVVHLVAQQKQYGLGIDQDLHALVLDDLVGGTDLVGVFDRIGLPGAAAVLDADPQAHDLGIGAFGQISNALRRRVGQLHDLRAGPRLGLGRRRWCSGCHLIHVVNPKGKSMPAIF